MNFDLQRIMVPVTITYQAQQCPPRHATPRRCVEPCQGTSITNPDLLGPRPFWQTLERENARRPLGVLSPRTLDLYS